MKSRHGQKMRRSVLLKVLIDFLIHLRSVTKQDSRQKPSAFFAHHFGCCGQINPLKQRQPIQQQIYAPRFPF